MPGIYRMVHELLEGEVFRYVDIHCRPMDFQLYIFHGVLYDRQGRTMLRVQIWHGEPAGPVYVKMAHYERAEVMFDTVPSIPC